MRKISGFLLFSLFVLILFSCEFQIPKGVEVYGTPTLSFAAHNDIGKTFEGMNTNGDQSIECIATSTRTYIIRKEIMDDDFLATAYPGIGTSYTPSVDTPISLPTNLTISVDFSAVLTNFELQNPHARIYIYSGDSVNEPLVDLLLVDVKVTADGVTKTYNKVNKMKSGLSDTDTTYAGNALPGKKDTDIELPLNSPDFDVIFEIIIPAGKEVQAAWFDGNLYTEILIWVPLIFEAIDHAEVVIPPGYLFPVGKDLFGRSSPDGSSFISDYVQSMELSIILNQNPFIGRELVIWSGSNIELSETMKGNALSFSIGNEDMEKINKPENYPFEPNFKILFEYNPVKGGDKLVVPRELTAHELVFRAKVNYKTKF